MLNHVHFLLSYACTFECDHCFLYCSPEAPGTFTLDQIDKVLGEIEKMPSVEWVYFEGGEPFLFYPLMLEGIRRTRQIGRSVGIVTNAYWATTAKDAELWLEPLCDLGISDLSLSDDAFHQGDDEAANTARRAHEAAQKLGLPVGTICIDSPETEDKKTQDKGDPVIGGNTRFRGRAVEKLTEGLPRCAFGEFRDCPYEELEKPKRVHIDTYGHVQACQGVSIGNMWKTPLSQLVAEYDAHKHPICGPLLKGGPVELARQYGVEVAPDYVDHCHACFEIRKALIDRFPEYLAPRQVYGLNGD
jgi:organic radical activating enzyme